MRNKFSRNAVKIRGSPRCRKEVARFATELLLVSLGAFALGKAGGARDIPSRKTCRCIITSALRKKYFIGGIKMKKTRIFAGIMAAAVISAATATGAFAQEESIGKVAFTAIKSTIGQGFEVEPVMVPLYEGDTGLDIAKRAATIQYSESDYGPYITGFADTAADISQISIPSELEALVPEIYERASDEYLSSMDFTPESGWSYFVNGEYAMVGIGDYIPQDGDVLEFRFSIYGYGADLGVDNSSWGGAAAVVEPVNAAKLIKLCAKASDEVKNSYNYVSAMETLTKYGATQEQIDSAVGALTEAELIPIDPEAPTGENTDNGDADSSEDKGSPDTGVEGIALLLGMAVIAGGAVAITKKTR